MRERKKLPVVFFVIPIVLIANAVILELPMSGNLKSMLLGVGVGIMIVALVALTRATRQPS